MYYMLECFGSATQERQAIIVEPSDFTWNRGKPFTNPPTSMLEIEMALWFPCLIVAFYCLGVPKRDWSQ